MNQNNICTWLCIDEKGEESLFPQSGVKSSSSKHQNIYWRCIVVFFVSSKRFNKQEKHILFTNTRVIPTIDGKDIGNILKDLDVEIIYVPFNHKTPKNYWGTFQNQFYEFSILQYISENVSCDQDQYLILDSDCFFIKPISPLFILAEKNGGFSSVKHEPVPVNYSINGLSHLDMKSVFEDILDRKLDVLPDYYLGEFMLANVQNIKKFSKDFENLWKILLKRFELGLLKFNEEAQTLSFIYYMNGYVGNLAKPFVRRIWTNIVFFRNAVNDDSSLSIWHLPAEKRFGFEKMYNYVIKNQKNYAFEITDQEYLLKAFNFFSVPKLTLKRKIEFYLVSYWRAGSKKITMYFSCLN